MRRIHALALIPLFALAACSAPAATPTPAAPASSAAQPSTPASSAPAPAGNAITGEGYTLTLPEGWKEATDAFKKLQPQIDTGAKDGADTKDGFNDNVNVIVQASPGLPLDQLASTLKTQLESAGSTNVQLKENVQLDGQEGIQVWSRTKGAGDAHTIQFLAVNAEKLYIVTVSSNRSETKAGALAQQLISGWKWASA